MFIFSSFHSCFRCFPQLLEKSYLQSKLGALRLSTCLKSKQLVTTYNSVDHQPAVTAKLFTVSQRPSCKTWLERHNSLYPSNTHPLPNLRKCKSSVNKAEAAPLQFSPHSGGEGSISGESMVSLWLSHSKGSAEERGEGVCACLQRP